MEWCPPLHLGVVATEKGAFGSPSTKVANFNLPIFSLIPFFVNLDTFILIFKCLFTTFGFLIPSYEIIDKYSGMGTKEINSLCIGKVVIIISPVCFLIPFNFFSSSSFHTTLKLPPTRLVLVTWLYLWQGASV